MSHEVKNCLGGSDNVLGYRTTFYLPAKVSESPGLQWKTLSYFESMISQNAEGKKFRGFDFSKVHVRIMLGSDFGSSS